MKDETLKNPFILFGYASPQYFCDRVEETSELVESIENGRNVTLLAPRRMGKTGLIKNVFHQLQKEGKWNTAYVDVSAAQNLKDFTRCLGAAILGSMDGRLEKSLRTAAAFLRSFRPVISINPLTGEQSCSFTLDSQNVEASLKECFDYLAADGRKCVVAIDEFQQVADFPEKGAEALLRSYIQFLPNTRFIFSGSKRHLMAEMFSAPKRPFYNSSQMFPLGTIDRNAYFSFAARHMLSAGVELKPEVFYGVYDMFDGVTWYVQAVMNRLYGYRSALAEDVMRAINCLMGENGYAFLNLLETLPSGSVRLLKAIAAEGKVRELTAGDFMARHGLRAHSSVKLSLAKLMNLGLVCKDDLGNYLVDDRLFGIWLARQ